ncbi:MAG: hypothetical protein FWH40_03715 [Coriobacteriia bacterium]|nr:hypothetical protein [Coriobacteriia bacterium]
MAKQKTQCHICNFEVKDEVLPDYCPHCGTFISDPSQETKIMSAFSNYQTPTDKIAKQGTIYLTNLRLIIARYTQVVGAGLAGALVGAAVNKIRDDWGFSIPLADIVSAEEVKAGLIGKLIAFQLQDGSVIKISATPRDKWIEATLKARDELLALNR